MSLDDLIRSSEDLQNPNIKSPSIREARELLKLVSQKPEDRPKYADRIDKVLDYYSALSAERHYAFQEGIKLGLEQTEKKHQQAFYQQIARDLLVQGVSLEIIAATTHLAIDEIKKLLH